MMLPSAACGTGLRERRAARSIHKREPTDRWQAPEHACASGMAALSSNLANSTPANLSTAEHKSCERAQSQPMACNSSPCVRIKLGLCCRAQRMPTSSRPIAGLRNIRAPQALCCQTPSATDLLSGLSPRCKTAACKRLYRFAQQTQPAMQNSQRISNLAE